MPQNVKSRGILQCPAISPLTLFGIIKAAQLGATDTNFQVGKAFPWEENTAEGRDNHLDQRAGLLGKGCRVMTEKDLAENMEMSGTKPGPQNMAQSSFPYILTFIFKNPFLVISMNF